MLSDVMEDYLKAIYRLEREGEEEPVSTSAIADHLAVSAPTVTSMLRKLEERGLVDYEKYVGARLTEEGETVALEVLRHHRLLESYLAEHLDYSWSEVHDEADALEHHISEEFERRIAQALDDPEVDPHGDPIPDEDLSPLSEEDVAPLSEFSAGDHVVIARVRDRDEEEMEYLAAVGIKPGRELEIDDVTPIGTYVVIHDRGTEHLPEEIADAISVKPVAEDMLDA